MEDPIKLAAPALLGLMYLGACSTFRGPRPEPIVQAVSLTFGEREIDDSNGLPGLGDLDVIGVTYDGYAPHAALGWELALMHARDEVDLSPSGSSEVRVTELAGGVRKTFGPGELGVRGLYPYIGAGLSVFYTDSEVRGPGQTTASDEDFDAGLYVHFGFYGRIADRWRLGLDYRLIREQWLDIGELDLDGDQLALTLGVSF